MKRSQNPSTTIDPTQPAAPRAVFEDKSAVPPTPQIALTPPRHGTAAAPAGSAAYVSQAAPDHHQQVKDIKQRASAAVNMAKHASDAGLAGVAEAAGHLIGELTPASKWRQEILQIRLVAGLTLAMLLGYTLCLAPRKLGFWGELALVLRGCSDNALSFALFNMLGIMPAILACVAWPVLRNKNYKAQPMRPYLMASFATGAFAFLSHIARWSPSKTPAPLPPTRLSGSTAWLQRLSESRLLPASLLASTLYFYIFPFIATPATWAHFGYLFTHSLTVHVMTLDFSLLTLLSPWLVIRDAAARGWGVAQKPAGRWLLGLAMLAAPAAGPAVYLLLRPISPAGYGVGSLSKDILSLMLRRPKSWLNGHSRQQQQQQQQSPRSEVEAAAAVPLPSAPILAASAVAGLVKGVWDGGWLWVGQRVARMRGGGGAVATSDEVDGDEHDIDGGDYAVAPDTHLDGHTSGTRIPTFMHALGDFMHRHQQQQQHVISPGPTPKKTAAADGGIELEFSEDYDEFDADTTTDSSDDEIDSVSDVITDDDDDDVDDEMVMGDEGMAADKQVTQRGVMNGGLAGFAPRSVGVVHSPRSKDQIDDQHLDLDHDVDLDQYYDDHDDGEIFVSDQVHEIHSAAAAAGVGHHSRAAKDLALKRLAELGHQIHPRMTGTVV